MKNDLDILLDRIAKDRSNGFSLNDDIDDLIAQAKLLNDERKRIMALIEGDCRFCRLVLVEHRTPHCKGCVKQNKKFWEEPWRE